MHIGSQFLNRCCHHCEKCVSADFNLSGDFFFSFHEWKQMFKYVRTVKYHTNLAWNWDNFGESIRTIVWHAYCTRVWFTDWVWQRFVEFPFVDLPPTFLTSRLDVAMNISNCTSQSLKPWDLASYSLQEEDSSKYIAHSRWTLDVTDSDRSICKFENAPTTFLYLEFLEA
jgi:hypothetical protein